MTKPNPVYAVGDLTRYLKSLLEQDPLLRYVSVSGEVSNLTYHGSGHVYFSLKDRDAQLSCAMFKQVAMSAPRIKAGDQVVVTGNISVYPPRGNYQLIVGAIRKAGLGDLFQRFVELKDRLQKEGLFETIHKKVIPRYPSTIAIVTSPTGAAVRDVIRTIKRRYDAVDVYIVPATVQGERGSQSIITALQQAADLKPDLIILTRGGGSLEDLWNFNEESVARAIFSCEVPIICGVGHETDATIADFVADLRAATPTAAAELSVPEKAVLVDGLANAQRLIKRSLGHYIDFRRQLLDDYGERLKGGLEGHIRDKKHELNQLRDQSHFHILRHVSTYKQLLKDQKSTINASLIEKHTTLQQELKLLSTRLDGMSRDAILAQGYTLTLKDGKIANNASQLSEDDEIETIFADGRVTSQIKRARGEKS